MNTRVISLPLISFFTVVAVTQQQQMFFSYHQQALLVLVGLLGVMVITCCLSLHNRFNILLVLMVTALIMLAYLKGGDLHIGAIFSFLVTMCAATLIYRFGGDRLAGAILLLPFWYYAAFIVFRLLVDPDPNKVFVNSRNWISFYLILFVAVYYINGMMRQIWVSPIPALVCLLLSVQALGRSGIVASLCVIVAVMVYKHQLWRLVAMLGILGVGFYFLIFPTLSEVEISRMSNPFGGDDRAEIWMAYFSGLNLETILIGHDLHRMEADTGYTNLHSSLLTAVFHLGAAGYLIWALLLCTLLALATRSLALTLAFSAVLIRISTDVGALFGLYDTPLWLATLYVVRGPPKSQPVRVLGPVQECS